MSDKTETDAAYSRGMAFGLQRAAGVCAELAEAYARNSHNDSLPSGWSRNWLDWQSATVVARDTIRAMLQERP